MHRISIPEYGRIARSAVSAAALRSLQEFDEHHARRAGNTVFDWSYRAYVAAKSFVGVIQVPGLSVELLPKVDAAETLESELRGEERSRAQRNLLYMLSMAGELPLQERSLASLRLQRFGLLDALVHVFSLRLMEELGRGVERSYVVRRENERFVRGKLLLSDHIRRNLVHKERVFVEYEEFSADTLTNRILRATCEALLRLTMSPTTQRNLKTSLLHLDEVSLVTVRDHDFEQVHLTRATRRFEVHLDFCRMVLAGMSPTPGSGASRTFSLLFPMERVFEGFVGGFIRRHAARLGLGDQGIHLQARRRRRHLLTRDDGKANFLLKPDILVDDSEHSIQLILDTKWKLLKSDDEDVRNGVPQSDLYQLFAYAMRYSCPLNVLVYPRVPGRNLTNKTYFTQEAPRKALRVAFVDVSADLVKSQHVLAEGLENALLLCSEDHDRIVGTAPTP